VPTGASHKARGGMPGTITFYVTDAQIYLAIGIPSALFALNFTAILAAAFWQAKRFDDLKDVFRSEMAG